MFLYIHYEHIVHEHVCSGAAIYTDLNVAYKDGTHRHYAVNHSVEKYASDMARANEIKIFWALLEHSMSGTFHHASKKDLPWCLDEFTFRLNEGNCEVEKINRMDSLAKGMEGKRIPYEVLVL